MTKLTDAQRNTLQACSDWAAPFEITSYRNDATGEIVDLGGLRNTLGWLRNRGLVEYGMMNDTWRITPAGRAALEGAER